MFCKLVYSYLNLLHLSKSKGKISFFHDYKDNKGRHL